MLENPLQRWNEEMGLDEHLPGTLGNNSHYYQRLADNYPYHIMGRNSLSSAQQQERGSTKSMQLFREQESLRRRKLPSCFEEACAYGNLQATVWMWAQGLVDIPTRQAIYEGNNASALMWAAFKGHLSIVRFLVDQGAPLQYTNALGHTALHWAITAGNTDVARYLLDHGADPSHCDRQGFDAAFTAVQSDRLALLLMLTEDTAREGHLLQTSDHGLVFYKPSAEQEALAATCVNPRTNKPYYLLSPKMRDIEGHTLMHWAAYRNSPATCQYLLDHWSYDVDAQDNRGRTPLVWAAREGFAEVIELLLSRGADRNIADSEGQTALSYARLRRHVEAVYVLVSYPTSSRNEAPSCVTDTAAASLHGTDSENTMRTALLAKVAAASAARPRYVSVRERRVAGTLCMMYTNITFAAMAIAGPVYIVFTFFITHMLPPVVNSFPFGLFFLKNILWNALMPKPTQSSRNTDRRQSPLKELDVPGNFADSARGTWRYRMRDPVNLCAWLSFLVVQVYAWNSLGLVPLFSSRHTAMSKDEAAALWGATTPPSASSTDGQSMVHYAGLSLLRLLTLQSNPLDKLQTNAVAPHDTAALTAAQNAYVTQSTSLVRWTLMLCLLASVTCAVLCKLLAGRSILRASEEGTLRTSPVWRITASRQYRWLHPRFFLQERHMQIPLRAFYCHERDAVVHGYDGYSSLLDSPIGRSNHIFFALSLTFFVLFEALVMVWGIQKTGALLGCPADVPWYRDALYGFQATETLAATVLKSQSPTTDVEGRAGTLPTNMTSQTLSPSAQAAGAPIASLAWLHMAMEVTLHGLPCRQYKILNEITVDYVKAELASSAVGKNHRSLLSPLRRCLFFLRYYIWPTRASMLGVWLFHYSALAMIVMGTVVLRQWLGVWRGATRMELANPLAQGSNGELVSIFPKDPQQAQRVEILNEDEERYYASLSPSKKPTSTTGSLESDANKGGRCLYADGNGIINVLAFLLGRNGKRWVGAMTVSPHNTPVRSPMLT